MGDAVDKSASRRSRKPSKRKKKNEKKRRRRDYSISSSSTRSSNSSYQRQRRKKKRRKRSMSKRHRRKSHHHHSSSSETSSSSLPHDGGRKDIERKRKKKKDSKQDERRRESDGSGVGRKLVEHVDGEDSQDQSSARVDNAERKQAVVGIIRTTEAEHKQQAAARRMVPMTREQYEAEQSKVREVFDPETGRLRLVRGSGEIIERIVTREAHQQINQQATRGDGASFSRMIHKASSSSARRF